ncbi:MAG TPA: cellulose biosynthesis cyclic di-GMP-binding regulatory protein BcsB [Microvirga sp.]|jgi:hypothetical protein|nr:cellulose biosynthesis cyclic di-GMP-binding regulatory protein BcsB [Microvirga sp.]
MRRSPLLLLAAAVLTAALGPPAAAQVVQRTPGGNPASPDATRFPGPAAPRTMPSPAGERPGAPAPAPGLSTTVAPFRMDNRPGAPTQAQRAEQAAAPAPLRPILPLGPQRLAGESDGRTWTIELTAAEAQGATGLSIGYTNAVVVMPEVSRLRVFVNGEAVSSTPISSAAGVSRVNTPLRPGLLKAGENLVRIEVLQRHRVDCSVTGTYELWTDLDPAATGLVFAGGGRPPVGAVQELAAIGYDPAGVTTIHMVAPRAARPEVRDRLFRVAQTVALRGRFPHPVVQISESDPGPSPPGTLKVVLALASELPLAMPVPPGDPAVRPFVGFVVGDERRGATLVISGPGWADVDRAIALLSTYQTREADGGAVPTSSWSAPDAPLVLSGRALRFSELGIPTTEFSGRRLTTRFMIALPGDFYAGDYGEARLLLDAAIAPAVRPGSRIDVYVNERISATAPIGIGQNAFEQHPIRVAMKYFRPGLNMIVVESILATAADESCAPGSTLPGANRLALFDSTSFEIPNFARIGRRPDLAEVTSAGFLRREDGPVAVALPRFDLPLYASAATIVTRMAIDARRVLNVRSGTVADAPGGSVIFVGPAGQLPPDVLGQVGLPQDLGQVWTAPAPPPADPLAAPAPTASAPPRAPSELQDRATTGSSTDVRNRWDETLRGDGRIARAIDSVQRWFNERFSAGVTAVRTRQRGGVYDPPPGASWLIAEGASPDRDGSWLVVTAPTEHALREGSGRITRPTLWADVAGRITALLAESDRLVVQAVETFEFVTTEPLTPRNLRLIAANWLSTNVLPYALLIILGCTGLGLATHFLVGQLGRRS